MTVQNQITALQAEQDAIVLDVIMHSMFAGIDVNLIEDEITDLKIVQLCLTGK